MLNYIIRRVLYAIPTVFGVLVLTYFLFFGTVSREAIARQNLSSRAPTQAQIKEWLQDHGYGEPTMEAMQEDPFGRFLLGIGIKPKEDIAEPAEAPPAPAEGAATEEVQNYGTFEPSLAARLLELKRSTVDVLLLNFGKSDTTNEDIWERIQKGVPASFAVGSLIFVASLIVSLTFAVINAYFRGTYVDAFGTFLSVLLLSIVYVVYVIGLQFLLGKVLHYGPIAGFQTGPGMIKFLILPVVIGVISSIGAEIRLFRTFLLDEMNQDYVRTARAKGVDEPRVLRLHVLKNALIPVITSTVAAIPGLILGSLILENFFGIPGLGSYLVDAINSQDFAVVRAMVFLGTLLYIVGLILTDILYALVDPRVRIE
ncbi:MAG: ABC transporter permease [Armatimonadaceae bacterium]